MDQQNLIYSMKINWKSEIDFNIAPPPKIVSSLVNYSNKCNHIQNSLYWNSPIEFSLQTI